MRKTSVWACALWAVLVAAASAGSSLAEDRAGRWEAGPFLGGYVFDDELDLENSVVLGARGGYWLTDRVLGELSLAGVVTEEEHGDDGASLLQSHADLLYHFDLGWVVEPFLAAGLGAAHYDADSQGGSDWDFLVNYGVGARYPISDRIVARVDLRQPITFGSPKYNVMYTVGVSFLLGGPAPSRAEAPLPPPLPSATLTASPDAIRRGQSVVLTWATRDATDVSIDGIGAVSVSGSRGVAPERSTTYRLLAKGPGGTAEATAPVTVTAPAPPPPAVTFKATPGEIKAGAPTTLSWTTRDATDVSIDGLGPVGFVGSQSVTPSVTTTYHLVARGPGGTTEATAPVTVSPFQPVCIPLHIEFDFDKSDIKPKYHDEIGRVADFMKKYPETTGVIEGHTDSIGTRPYNEALSLRRASAVVAYLVDVYGLDPARLCAKGYGFSRPVADNETPAGRQKNRRIDAIIDCVVK